MTEQAAEATKHYCKGYMDCEKEYQEKIQKCIMGILDNYRNVETLDDLKWNKCNDVCLDIIKEEMGV